MNGSRWEAARWRRLVVETESALKRYRQMEVNLQGFIGGRSSKFTVVRVKVSDKSPTNVKVQKYLI